MVSLKASYCTVLTLLLVIKRYNANMRGTEVEFSIQYFWTVSN